MNSDMRTTIDPRELEWRRSSSSLDDWMLLTSGTFDDGAGEFNAMTVAWGFLGAMWRRPVAIAPVRSTRFTREFMERHDTWTLTAFPERHRPDLQILGTRSGRDGDKIGLTSLTPVAASVVAAPTWAEAVLSIECRTIYYNDIEPERMVDPTIDEQYADDYHRMYYGEILAVQVEE
jgi:flavin reductase (DIM6/NTAB) family NADH-FMN oxidoreductase RutF